MPTMRSWSFVALFAVVVLLLSGCLGGGNSPAGTSEKKPAEGAAGSFDPKSKMAEIQKRGKLLVAISLDQKPFAYADPSTGAYRGLDVELAKQIATGIFGTQIEGKIEWVQYSTQEFDLALRNGSVDIALGRYAITVPRKQFVDFAGPYYVTRQVVLVPKVQSSTRDGAKQIASLVELNGAKVCTVRGSTDLDAMRQVVPTAVLQEPVGSVAECGAKMMSGEVQALVAANVDLAEYLQIARNQAVALTPAFGADAYGVGVARGQGDLRTFVNDQIENWKDYDKVVEDQVSKGVPSAEKRPNVDRY